MKRFLILFGILLMTFVSSSAQEYKYEARLGWFPADVLNVVYQIEENLPNDTDFGPVRTAGIFSADFDYKVKKWLVVGAKVNYRNSWRDETVVNNGVKTTTVDRLQAFSVMPTVKFTTGYDSLFRYYATLGVGAGMDLSTGVNDAFWALQFTPVGIAVGKKISWYFELGIGHAFMGCMTGISWRF